MGIQTVHSHAISTPGASFDLNTVWCLTVREWAERAAVVILVHVEGC